MFNTLSAVQALCDNNPHKAKLLLGKLGLYLRQNIASLNSAELIPFQKELAHTKLYVEIEKERYGDISVEFDARDTDFLLPPLTVQPMVENAIRHGIRGLDRGKVSVIARKCEHHHEIIVRDNGIGFDKSSLSSLDSTHIGIKNVKERIEKLCHGSMTVDSQTGEGTAITICIPCREKTDCF